MIMWRRGRDSSGPISVRSVGICCYDLTPKMKRSSVVSLMCYTSTILYHLVMHFEGNGTGCREQRREGDQFVPRYPHPYHFARARGHARRRHDVRKGAGVTLRPLTETTCFEQNEKEDSPAWQERLRQQAA